MKKTPIIIAVALLLAAVAIGAYTTLTSATQNTTPVRLDLPIGAKSATMDSIVDANHLVKTHTLFNMIVHVRGLDKAIKPGSYLIQPHTRLTTLVQKLYHGNQDLVRITIGKHRVPATLNEYLCRMLAHDDFQFTVADLDHIRPNTYEVYWTVGPEQLRQRLIQEEDHFWNSIPKGGNGLSRRELLERITPHLTATEVTILASIVEEETNATEEKGTIASVYLNRLCKGMPLQADPTVKYAVGDFSLRRILNTHLATDSPFNTYIHTGLPPHAICTPSAQSIDAVLLAPITNYLYFCAKEDFSGRHNFACTLAEHNRNAERFHQAMNRRGIR